MHSAKVESFCLMTDIEGVAGVVTHSAHSASNGIYYEECKRLLTAEVNAAVEGLLAVGVKDILVIDGHGPGGIHFESLHPAARLLHGRPIYFPQMLSPIWDYDAFGIIGQHAMAGVRTGNQNHTLDSRRIDSIKLNGSPIGEIRIVGLWAGARNVPLIFLSGDQAGCEEAAKEQPNIVTAAVKQGISTNTEITLSATAARQLIREQIQKAVTAHRLDPLPPIKAEPPYRLEIRWKSTQDADASEHQTGCLRVDDQTVAYESTDILDVLNNRHRPQ